MLLGVPLFASFYYLLRGVHQQPPEKKGLPLATQDYVHVAGIDENGTISYMPPPSIEFHPCSGAATACGLRSPNGSSTRPHPIGSQRMTRTNPMIDPTPGGDPFPC
ncbi:MAG: hypothetical protein ACLUNZ_02490 [Evtepia sp.]